MILWLRCISRVCVDSMNSFEIVSDHNEVYLLGMNAEHTNFLSVSSYFSLRDVKEGEGYDGRKDSLGGYKGRMGKGKGEKATTMKGTCPESHKLHLTFEQTLRPTLLSRPLLFVRVIRSHNHKMEKYLRNVQKNSNSRPKQVEAKCDVLQKI